MPEEEVLVRDVQAKQTQSGNTRYVLVDEQGREFTTFKEAAPWLLGTSAPKTAVPPGELFEKLQPFKELVADDIRSLDGDDASEDDAELGS